LPCRPCLFRGGGATKNSTSASSSDWLPAVDDSLPPRTLPLTHDAEDHTGASKRRRLPPACSSVAAAANAPWWLTLLQVVWIQPSKRWMKIRNSSVWPLKGSAVPLTRTHAFLDPEVTGRDLDRALDHPDRVGAHDLQPIKRQACCDKRPFDAIPSGR
jgi:hypothetical protein